jgi:hypothetical protein
MDGTSFRYLSQGKFPSVDQAGYRPETPSSVSRPNRVAETLRIIYIMSNKLSVCSSWRRQEYRKTLPVQLLDPRMPAAHFQHHVCLGPQMPPCDPTPPRSVHASPARPDSSPGFVCASARSGPEPAPRPDPNNPVDAGPDGGRTGCSAAGRSVAAAETRGASPQAPEAPARLIALRTRAYRAKPPDTARIEWTPGWNAVPRRPGRFQCGFGRCLIASRRPGQKTDERRPNCRSTSPSGGRLGQPYPHVVQELFRSTGYAGSPVLAPAGASTDALALLDPSLTRQYNA